MLVTVLYFVSDLGILCLRSSLEAAMSKVPAGASKNSPFLVPQTLDDDDDNVEGIGRGGKYAHRDP
jgi:hypothetical protein